MTQNYQLEGILVVCAQTESSHILRIIFLPYSQQLPRRETGFFAAPLGFPYV